ncbi:hypothetical protein [Streptomyces sp. NPDC057552]|uniref:hypothetical protein n=1 Tax=Streptomyces sp. NPDC057552 TaxID=3350537 RepID=UPI0036A79967
MTTQPERLHHLLDRARRGVILPAEGEALAVLVGELEQRVDTARATARRLYYRTQQAESKNATYERAVRQWDFGERGTYIPHASLRAIGIAAAGTDILGSSIRHLRHFQRVEQAEARICELEAEVSRHRARAALLDQLLTEAVDWMHESDLRERVVAALNPPPPAGTCTCGRPDPGPCNPCPAGSPSLHCACVCQPTGRAATA